MRFRKHKRFHRGTHRQTGRAWTGDRDINADRLPGFFLPSARLPLKWVDKCVLAGILTAWIRLFTLGGTCAMTPLEQLFELEVEFYRRLRMDAGDTVDASSPHTSYAHRPGMKG